MLHCVRKFLRGAAAALLALAPQAGAAGLVATLTPVADGYDAAGPVELDFTLTNTGDTDLQVLAWDTPLRGIQNELFAVLVDGAPAPYTGVIAYREAPGVDDYLTLPAGGQLTVRLDLGAAYDLTAGGDYVVAYAPASLRVRRGDAREADLAAELRSLPVTLAVKGLSPEERALRQAQAEEALRSFSSNCSSTQRSLVNASLPVLRSLASSSRTAANATTSTRYRRWYGVFSSARHSKIVSVHNTIVNAANADIPFNCSCAGVCPGAVACTDRSRIWLCGSAFFSRGNGTAYGERGPVLLHELAHWGNTTDSGYGLTYCANIAASSPNTAVNNADNYHCFATNP